MAEYKWLEPVKVTARRNAIPKRNIVVKVTARQATKKVANPPPPSKKADPYSIMAGGTLSAGTPSLFKVIPSVSGTISAGNIRDTDGGNKLYLTYGGGLGSDPTGGFNASVNLGGFRGGVKDYGGLFQSFGGSWGPLSAEYFKDPKKGKGGLMLGAGGGVGKTGFTGVTNTDLYDMPEGLDQILPLAFAPRIILDGISYAKSLL